MITFSPKPLRDIFADADKGDKGDKQDIRVPERAMEVVKADRLEVDQIEHKVDDKIPSKITDEHREKTIDNLYNAVVESNKALSNTFEIDNEYLKSYDDVYTLAINTEHDMYDSFKHQPREYFETLLVFVVVLTDKTLCNDALLFRFLLNVRMTSLLEPTTHELIFAELLNCNGDCITKRNVLNNILYNIRTLMPHVCECYNKNRTLSLPRLKYKIPVVLDASINDYRERQLDQILVRLFNKFDKVPVKIPSDDTDSDDVEEDYDDFESDDERIFDIPYTLSSAMYNQPIKRYNKKKCKKQCKKLCKDIYKNTKESLDNLEAKVKNFRVSTIPKNVDELKETNELLHQYDDVVEVIQKKDKKHKIPNDDEKELLDSMDSIKTELKTDLDDVQEVADTLKKELHDLKKAKKTIKENLKEISEFEDEGKDKSSKVLNVDSKCKECGKDALGSSFCTPVLLKDGIQFYVFCCKECMEVWNPPVVAKMKKIE